jgi:hypothetical protein
MDTLYILLTKSNGYIVKKQKVGLNFFMAGGGEHTITFFSDLCNHYFLLTVYKLCSTTIHDNFCRLHSSQKSNDMSTPPAIKKI